MEANFWNFDKPFLGSREVPQKVLTWSVQPLWRLLDTNGQTETQTADKQSIYILEMQGASRPSF